MKLGLALDGLLCDTQSLKQEWIARTGDEKFLKEEPFWAALKPYSDVREAIGLLDEKYELYVFAERPKSVFLPTRAWLRRNTGIVLNKDRLIMQAIKRYDSRLLGVSKFIDSDPAAIENLKIETVFPVATYHVDRSGGASLLNVARRI